MSQQGDPRRTHRHKEQRKNELAGGPLCFKCSQRPAKEIHHIQPIAKGGHPYDPRNRVPLCRECHAQESINPTFYLERNTSWQKSLPHSLVLALEVR